jgi:hypothetical protein
LNTAGLGFIVSVHKAGDPELYIYEAKPETPAEQTEASNPAVRRDTAFDPFLLVHFNAASREAFGGPEKVRGRLGSLISEICLT